MISQEVLSKPQPLDADSAQWVIDQFTHLVRGQGGPTALREVALNLLRYLRAKGYNAPEDIFKTDHTTMNHQLNRGGKQR